MVPVNLLEVYTVRSHLIVLLVMNNYFVMEKWWKIHLAELEKFCQQKKKQKLNIMKGNEEVE